MEPSTKRKAARTNGTRDNGNAKRSKGGSGNKWQTPAQREKLDSIKVSMLAVGDAGIWVTCQRGKERQARGEMARICEDYGKKLYNIDPPEDAAGSDDGDGNADDIEASIQKELEGMKPANRPKDPPFEMVWSGLDCLFFVRVRKPVEPIEFTRQVCIDAGKPAHARATPGEESKQQQQQQSGEGEGAGGGGGERRSSAIGFSRFVNRFTPVTLLGRASEKGLEDVAKKVLADHFVMAREEGEEGEEGTSEKPAEIQGGEAVSSGDAPSYAIRPTFRAHNQLKRDEVIKKIASLIDDRHAVNLTKPDKVILVDIYQTFCGMSVVGGDWEALKKFNIHELKVSADAASKVKTKKDQDGGEDK